MNFFFFFPKAFHDYCLSLGNYVGFHSTTIIQYLEPLTGNLFTARFVNCHFDESIFPPLGGDKQLIINGVKLLEIHHHCWNLILVLNNLN